MNKPILIVGGGPAGLAAAHALARVGQNSVVVEKQDRLGGAPILSGYAKLVPSGEWARDAIGGMVDRVRNDPLVDVQTSARVESFAGQPGAFSARLSNGASVDAAAAILCTGFTHFDSVNKPEWGFGTFPDVVTTTQVEQMISSGKGVRCPSDGRKPKRVAILLCVGSRDRQIGREWCSKICCTVSANMAMEIREELPDCHVYIYYMDIRTYGLYETRYYWRSQEEFKVKYIKARIAEVTSNGEQLVVKGEDTLVKRPITIPFDMVVHAIGMDPNVDNKTIASTFGIDLERHGYVARGNAYGNTAETSRAGVFVAGAACGPETIDDSIAQGHAAALAALGLLQPARARLTAAGGMFGRSSRASVPVVPEGPQLDLSGPRLRRAFEALVQGADDHGGVERYVDALKLKQTLFREALLSPDGQRARQIEAAAFMPLCAFLPTVRRRIVPWLAEPLFSGLRNAIATLLEPTDDRSGTDTRIRAFCAGFPQDDAHRWTRDLAAELLHNSDPERYPLMTRWVWDAGVNTGVLREIWHAPDVDHVTIAARDDYPTLLVLRAELSQFLSGNGVFRDVLQFVDMLCAQVYAGYIGEQGGSYLRTDFTAPEDPMLHSRRLLGLDGIRPGTGRLRIKTIDGEALSVADSSSPPVSG